MFPLYGTSLALRSRDAMSIVLMSVGFLLGVLILSNLGWFAVIVALGAWALGTFLPLQGTALKVTLLLLSGVALYGIYWLAMWLLGLVGLTALLHPAVTGLVVLLVLLVAISLLFQPAPGPVIRR